MMRPAISIRIVPTLAIDTRFAIENIDALYHGQSSAICHLGAAHFDSLLPLPCPNIRGCQRTENYEQGAI